MYDFVERHTSSWKRTKLIKSNYLFMVKNLYYLRKTTLLFLLLLSCSLGMKAQSTTSSIMGTASDEDGVLPGAVITVVHEPSGTKYATVANADGQYHLSGLRPGGPYRVESSYVGHQKTIVNVKRILLGQVHICNVTLNPGDELAEVHIVGKHAAEKKTGSSENYTEEDMLNKPYLNRGIDDLLVLSPYFSGSGAFGGRNAGMNNYCIDGANFNFNMGLDFVKMPGGGTSPLSVDALDEMQIVTSAFDVKNSNFIGATVNAVTKSGTNIWKGSAYTYLRNEYFRGNEIDGVDLGERQKEQRNLYGFTLGGPIIKDKLFIFANVEYENSPRPIHKWKVSADGNEDANNFISRVTAADMQQFAQVLKDEYGWAPGSYTNFDGDNDMVRILGRIDWNISSRHHLMVRYNQTNVKADQMMTNPKMGEGDSRIGIYSMAFNGSNYHVKNNVYSLTAELNSNLSDNIHNKFIGSFTFTDANNRECDADFPNIEIMKTYDGDNKNHVYMSAGYDPNAWNNGIKEKTWNVTDNMMVSLGRHYLTLGASFESINTYNNYMKYGAGYYRYASFEDFVNKAAPVAFALTYSLTGEKLAKADVNYRRFSVYAQDEWNVNDRLRLLYGIRMDMPMYTNDRYVNPLVADLDFGGKHLNTADWPKSVPLFSPRVGFNYDVTEDGSVRLRGGSGIFTGRFPLILLSKIQEGSGMLNASIQISNSSDELLAYLAGGVRTPDQIMNEVVPNLPENLQNRFPRQTSSTNTVTIDRNFKMPQVWKSTLAADVKLPVPFDAVFTLEGTFAKDINALTIYDANIDGEKVESTRFGGADNRYFYPGVKQKRILTDKGYAYELTNTNKGYSANVMAQLKMNPVKNLDLMAAYTYTVSKTMNSIQSNQIDGAMNNLPTVNGYNYQQLGNARYNYSPHRLMASASYQIHYAGNHASTKVTLFYEGKRQNSYSYQYVGDMNNDGIKNNDLLWIPASKDELLFKDLTVNTANGKRTFTAAEQSEAFWAFVNQDPYLSKHKGEYAGMFGAFNPWYNRFDLRLVQEFKVKAGNATNRLQFCLDVLNIGNLLKDTWGVYKVAHANAVQPLKREGVDANNTPIYTMSTYKDSEGNTKLIDHTFDYYRNTANCWQMQIGVRYIFN